MKKLAFITVVFAFANTFADTDMVQVRSLEVLQALDTLEQINVTQEVEAIKVVDQSADVELILRQLDKLDALEDEQAKEN